MCFNKYSGREAQQAVQAEARPEIPVETETGQAETETAQAEGESSQKSSQE
jgi:hypothetical protein